MPTAFIIGATGFVGGGIARHLISCGWQVRGLARSPTALKQLQDAGIDPIVGNLEHEFDAVLSASRAHDVTLYAAQIDPAAEQMTVARLLSGLADSRRNFIFLSGSGVLCQRTKGAWSADSFSEAEAFQPEPLAEQRAATERLVQAASKRGLRAMVIRPPQIWGPGDHGHVSMVYRSVSATGAACYVGNGLATYGHVHIEDVATLFVRATEVGEPGALYHGVAGEVPNRWIAEAVARDLGVPLRSISMEEAAAVWGDFGALIMSVSSRIRDASTRAALRWSPRYADMLSEIGEPRLRALAANVTTKE
ncbi:NAD-dependent epimerase/dehydratase family protein [Sphingomonas naphthae]|uniref:NAD-dependent epimerase/dehydratase family protein n=1 Tax=Sphingomonas naphthae TaxID=1813468 RepID=A0ABY7TI65_9SPHN|nr:NAD-dependent epimerase/dehydratase family protein [Sphingomonas naphthae]WCT72593.1 NAD-dependent epimerase/dehydratase family protein [Sphingomonas naphthae]